MRMWPLHSSNHILDVSSLYSSGYTLLFKVPMIKIQIDSLVLLAPRVSLMKSIICFSGWLVLHCTFIWYRLKDSQTSPSCLQRIRPRSVLSITGQSKSNSCFKYYRPSQRLSVTGRITYTRISKYSSWASPRVLVQFPYLANAISCYRNRANSTSVNAPVAVTVTTKFSCECKCMQTSTIVH